MLSIFLSVFKRISHFDFNYYLFIDNISLTSQNSLSHLLDFNDDYTDLTHCIQPSKYYSDGDFMSKLNTNYLLCSIISQCLYLQLTSFLVVMFHGYTKYV